MIEPCVDGGVEESHHRDDNSALPDESDQRVKNGQGVVVETHDESPLDLQTRFLEGPDACDQIPVFVRCLPAFLQAFFIRAFDPDEHFFKSRLGHQVQQSRVVGEVERRLGPECERIVPCLRPPDDQRENFLLQLNPVANKIVIDKKHVAAPPAPVQGVQLHDHLRRGFRAGQTSVENCDVAELTVVRAAARVLNIHCGVLAGIDQVPPRQWGCGQIRPLICFVQVFRFAGLEIIEKPRQRYFRLVQDEMIHPLEFLMPGGKQRSASNDLRPHLVASGNNLPRRIRLNRHPAKKDVVGPSEILGGERGQIEIDKPLLPIERQESGNGQQSQGRLPGFLGNEPESVLERPEVIRIFGADEKDIHRSAFPGRNDVVQRHMIEREVLNSPFHRPVLSPCGSEGVQVTICNLARGKQRYNHPKG